MVSNYQLSHLRSGQDSNSNLTGGRLECCHSSTVAPGVVLNCDTVESINHCLTSTKSYKDATLIFVRSDITCEAQQVSV